jgi:tellurite resistance protein
VARLILTEDLARAYVGALLTVCRADGDVNSEELEALRRIAGELTPSWVLDGPELEGLLFSQVTPALLAAAVGARGPFRDAGASDPARIRDGFLEAALRLARCDGSLNQEEVRTLRAFAKVLGSDHNEIKRLESFLDEGPTGPEN